LEKKIAIGRVISIIIIIEPKLKNVIEIWGFYFNDYENNQTYDL
jgi:hypothetical protein